MDIAVKQNPQSQVILSANSIAIANPPNASKKIFWYIANGLVYIAIIVLIFMTVTKKNNTTVVNSSGVSNSTTQNQGNKSQTTNNGLPNPAQNPLNDNGSINSQVQYCTNAVNASLVC